MTTWTRERPGLYRSADGRFTILRDRATHWRSHDRRFGVPDSWDLLDGNGRLIRTGFQTLAAAKAAAR